MKPSAGSRPGRNSGVRSHRQASVHPVPPAGDACHRWTGAPKAGAMPFLARRQRQCAGRSPSRFVQALTARGQTPRATPCCKARRSRRLGRPDQPLLVDPGTQRRDVDDLTARRLAVDGHRTTAPANRRRRAVWLASASASGSKARQPPRRRFRAPRLHTPARRCARLPEPGPSDERGVDP